MKTVLLVYLPFCTPASPPYSLTYLYSFLKNNCDAKIKVLDLNLEFHKLKFPEFQEYFKDPSKWKDYDKKTNEYNQLTRKVYSENNRKVVNGEKPEFFDVLLKNIREEKPDIVGFSIVYSSQAFYAHALMKELKEVTKIVGGPSVNDKIIALADKFLKNEIEFLDFIKEEKTDHEKLNFDTFPDFNIYDLKEYFTPKPVIPLKTSSTCYYQKCTFCAHYAKVPYVEYKIPLIEKTIINSGQKYFFLIDDMTHITRLLKLAEMMKPLNIQWACQLRPTKEYTYEILKKLKESGLTFIMWGVESGSNRILNLMKKGTNTNYVEKVLEDSKKAGIQNITYIMFGFPTETKEEFLETIDLLKRNGKNIDLVSIAVFGLQKGTPVYTAPLDFGIKKINEEERIILEPKISYELENGLTQAEAVKLKKKYNNTINKINKHPRLMNFFREHTFFSIKNSGLKQ
ncbi:radical SAM protein [Candidatus Woesearchaeota archaeon]|nr:radical SAM protein [Candidatus Woesearchaeota archaeon]